MEKTMMLEGKPLQGEEKEQLKKFLQSMKLEYDEGIEYSVCFMDKEGSIIATGSVEQNVIKCVAVSPAYQGQGYCAVILSCLIQYEVEQYRSHIFIYTKPENLDMFSSMGFYTILMTENVLFMENRKHGFEKFLEKLYEETPQEALSEGLRIGAIIANCNPFTFGHRYLIEQALAECDYVHLFILTDNRSLYKTDERFKMAEWGVEDLKGVILHRTSDYMISAAAFPTYFFKDKMQGKNANCRLDLALFGGRIAPKLRINTRFVGTEPFCSVTGEYNRQMKELLPVYGITVKEIERSTIGKKSCRPLCRKNREEGKCGHGVSK